MLDLEALEARLAGRPPDWEDAEALIGEVKTLRAENAALRLLAGEMASAVKAGDVTCLHLITRVQRTLDD